MAAPCIKVTSPSFSSNPILRSEIKIRYPRTVFHDSKIHLAGDALADYLADAEGAVIGLERIDAALLDRCTDLRIIAKYGVGLDNIDIVACEQRGVAIGWSGGVNRRSVAELALCLMLGLCRNVFRTSTLLRSGHWQKEGGVQLSGKTVGIIGLGFVGREVVRLLSPLECRILGNDVVPIADYCRQSGVVDCDKHTIFSEADVITLHVPSNPTTIGFVNAGVLAKMKTTAMLINTSRGDVVDQAALKQALVTGAISGAALDVFEMEPPTDIELLSLPNLVATAHIGGSAAEAVLAMGRSAIGHLDDFFASQPTMPSPLQSGRPVKSDQFALPLQA